MAFLTRFTLHSQQVSVSGTNLIFQCAAFFRVRIGPVVRQSQSSCSRGCWGLTALLFSLIFLFFLLLVLLAIWGAGVRVTVLVWSSVAVWAAGWTVGAHRFATGCLHPASIHSLLLQLSRNMIRELILPLVRVPVEACNQDLTIHCPGEVKVVMVFILKTKRHWCFTFGWPTSGLNSGVVLSLR